MVREDGEIDRIDRVLEADAVATVVTGLLFLAALVVTPVIGIVPAFATAPALIIVGVFMFRNVSKIDFGRLETGLPAFFTLIFMPLTYSISTGLAFGFIASVLTATAAGFVPTPTVSVELSAPSITDTLALPLFAT